LILTAGELANEIGKPREIRQTTRKNDTNSNAATANQIFITSDLISWALQIARGMEFMADKNVYKIQSHIKRNKLIKMSRTLTGSAR
jgi:hypothetical protein